MKLSSPAVNSRWLADSHGRAEQVPGRGFAPAAEVYGELGDLLLASQTTPSLMTAAAVAAAAAAVLAMPAQQAICPQQSS